jgi:hypothetical protein
MPARVFEVELEKLDENKEDIGLPEGFVLSSNIAESVAEPVALGARCIGKGVDVTEVDDGPCPIALMARK